MILGDLGPGAIFYRAFTPKWAHAPESGGGAALAGGRFNRPGLHARYLADTPHTAIAEYQAESALMPPATLVAFRVTARKVVDFRKGYDPKHWSAIWAEAYTNWKGLAFLEKIEPPSWIIGDLVREAGYPGILYKSVRQRGGICLVLFPEMQTASGFTAVAHDPLKSLPKDAASWEG